MFAVDTEGVAQQLTNAQSVATLTSLQAAAAPSELKDLQDALALLSAQQSLLTTEQNLNQLRHPVSPDAAAIAHADRLLQLNREKEILELQKAISDLD